MFNYDLIHLNYQEMHEIGNVALCILFSVQYFYFTLRIKYSFGQWKSLN